MTTISARVQDQVLTATILPKLACNNRKSVKLHVNYDSGWNSYAKSALFFTDKDPTVYPVVLNSSGDCIIPHEVLADEGYLYITMQGVDSSNGQIKSTTPISYKILPGTPSLVVSDPSPSVYEQLATKNKVLEARMNTIETGSTVEGSEVMGIRVGADGVEYPSAGDAVRAQANKMRSIYSALGENIKRAASGSNSQDILENCTWEDDVGLSSEDGKRVITGATGYRCITDFQPVLPNTTYQTLAYAVVCEYDVFGSFVVGHSFGTTNLTFTTSGNTAYILVAQRPNNLKPSVKYCDAGTIKKRLSVLGDSYSTYGGFVTPDTNRCFYNGENADEDTTDVSDMWWYKLIKDKGFLLEINNSHSGSPICNTGYNESDVSSFSFLNRMSNIGHPDIIAVFGGTNDSWANVPVGEYKYKGWSSDDLKTFRPAFAYMCEYLSKHHPNSEIYIIINSGLSEDITTSMLAIAEYYGLTSIELPTFDKPFGGHPGKQGQTAIYETVKTIVEG